MKAGRPPELMRFIITLLLLRLLLMAEVTQMRMNRLHKSISRDTLGPPVPAGYTFQRRRKLSRAQSFANCATLEQFQNTSDVKCQFKRVRCQQLAIKSNENNYYIITKQYLLSIFILNGRDGK